jgi:hypothetical protein
MVQTTVPVAKGQDFKCSIIANNKKLKILKKIRNQKFLKDTVINSDKEREITSPS